MSDTTLKLLIKCTKNKTQNQIIEDKIFFIYYLTLVSKIDYDYYAVKNGPYKPFDGMLFTFFF